MVQEIRDLILSVYYLMIGNNPSKIHFTIILRKYTILVMVFI